MMKKEIRFRARRGMKETDMLLARFLESELENLTADELRGVLTLLKDTYDQDLMNWFFDGITPPEQYAQSVSLIKKHAQVA